MSQAPSVGRRARAMLGPIELGQVYLPATFTDSPAPMHHDMVRVLRDDAVRQVAITGPSGGAKSAVLRAWLIHEAIVGDRLCHASVVGPIDKVARDQLAGLAKLIADSPELAPHIASSTADALELYKLADLGKPVAKRRTCLIRTSFPGTPIRSLSHTTQGKTYRLQVALLDDAERMQDVGSDAVLRRFRAFLYDELIPRIDWAGVYAKLVWGGNITPYSAFSRMFEGQPYRDPETGEEYGYADPARRELYRAWKLLRYDCYLRDGVTPYWVRWTEAHFRQMRDALAAQPGAFDRQFRQIARAESDDELPLELFTDERCYEEPLPASIDEARALWPGCVAVMALDDAETTEARSDESAKAVVVKLLDGTIHVVYLEGARIPVGQQSEWCIGTWSAWRPQVLIGEDARLLDQIVTVGRQRGHSIVSRKVSHGNTPKRTRMLETLRPAMASRTLKFSRARYDWRQRVRDGCSPGAEHDDIPDALQMAVAAAQKGGQAAVAQVQIEPQEGNRWYRESPRRWQR